MGDVLEMPVQTTLDIPVGKVLAGAVNCVEVIIIGTDANGEPYYASSSGDAYKQLWMLEKFKEYLLAESD